MGEAHDLSYGCLLKVCLELRIGSKLNSGTYEFHMDDMVY
jgi:hypothetical protein